MIKKNNYINGVLTYLSLEIFIFILYIELSGHFTPIGGMHSHLWFFEIPFLLALSLPLYFSEIKSGVIKYVAPAIIVLTPYLFFDIFYSFLSRSPRPSDVKNFRSIFDFSDNFVMGGGLISVLIFLCIYLLLYKSYKKNSIKFFYVIFFRILCVFFVVSYVALGGFRYFFVSSYEHIHWSQERSIRSNGRFYSFMYYGYKEKQNNIKLNNYRSEKNIYVDKKLYHGMVRNKVNIHFIVLESFIDPRLLEGVVFNRSPLSEELRPYLNKKKEFSKVLSPSYGGETAQAEFELLTGAKALAKIDSIEFNVMSGGQVSSFVNALKEAGYKTMATIASNSEYFNSPVAYKSLGFDRISFLEEEEDFIEKKDDLIIFDGEIFDYNIKKITSIIKNSDEPIFNYLLGMYGHFPYHRNIKERPDVINVSVDDVRVHKVSNQFFYRTRALGQYIRNIQSIDPDSIIYITSDHLPSLIDSGIHYQFDRNVNISILIRGGELIYLSGKKYFEIPWLIWGLLSGENREIFFQDGDMERLYFKLLSESVGGGMAK